jgi:uncharacterized membrane protein
MLQERPKLKQHLNGVALVLEVIAFTLLLLIWVYVGYQYSNLPNTIPIHFNAAGQANDWGSKATILIIPVIATAICFGFYFLCKVPHVHNYMVNITPQNAAYQYNNSTLLLRVVKILAMLIIGFTVNKSIAEATHQPSISWAIFYVVLITMLITPVVFILRMLKNK